MTNILKEITTEEDNMLALSSLLDNVECSQNEVAIAAINGMQAKTIVTFDNQDLKAYVYTAPIGQGYSLIGTKPCRSEFAALAIAEKLAQLLE